MTHLDIADISQLLTAISAVGALIVSIYNALRIREIKHSTNSMHDEVVKLTRISGIAEGRAIEKLDSEKQ